MPSLGVRSPCSAPTISTDKVTFCEESSSSHYDLISLISVRHGEKLTMAWMLGLTFFSSKSYMKIYLKQMCNLSDLEEFITLNSYFFSNIILFHTKGQIIWKANCQTANSSKKRMNEFVFTIMRCIFV